MPDSAWFRNTKNTGSFQTMACLAFTTCYNKKLSRKCILFTVESVWKIVWIFPPSFHILAQSILSISSTIGFESVAWADTKLIHLLFLLHRFVLLECATQNAIPRHQKIVTIISTPSEEYVGTKHFFFHTSTLKCQSLFLKPHSHLNGFYLESPMLIDPHERQQTVDCNRK